MDTVATAWKLFSLIKTELGVFKKVVFETATVEDVLSVEKCFTRRGASARRHYRP